MRSVLPRVVAETGLMRRVSRHVSVSRRSIVALWAVCVAVLLSSCAPYPENTFAPESNNAADIKNLFLFIILLAAVVYVIVVGLLGYTLWRYRGKPGDPRPAAVHGNTRVEIIWTALPVLILVIISIPTLGLIFSSQAAAPPGSVQVDATGHTWWFEFTYPDLKITTAGELHVPTGRATSMTLTSADVQHGFWSPRLWGKRDMIPNHLSYIWFTPDKAGFVDDGECTQLCGPSHAKMGFQVVVDTPAAFDAWVKNQQQPAVTPATPEAQRGQQLFLQSGCTACHTITGTAAGGTIGPNLTHVASRRMIAADQLPNNAASMQRWIKNPASVKPGEGQFPNTMPPATISDADIASIVAYLQTLK